MNPPANAGDVRDKSLIPGSGRSPGGGHGNTLQYSCIEIWTEEPGGLQSMRSQRVKQNWSNLAPMHACIIGHQVSFNNISGFENKLIQRTTSSQDLSPTELFNHHHCLVSKHFITPKRNPDPLAVISHSPFPLTIFCLAIHPLMDFGLFLLWGYY